MNNWIPISERLPTREDADNRGKVLWAYPDGVVTVGDFDSPYSNEHGDGWMPLPPYTPPKPGPTDEEIRMLFSIFARRNSWAFKDIRRWFADVTARIEGEREGGAIDARGFPLKERGK